MIICQHCQHSFSSKSSLNNHQKKAVYCLEIQMKTNNLISIEEAKKYICSYCDKAFAIKEKHNNHEEICPSKSIKQKLTEAQAKISIFEIKLTEACTKIELYQEQIRDLKEQLKEKDKIQERLNLAAISKPSTSTSKTVKNTLIQQFAPITEAQMREQVEHLTKEHIQMGAQGYAQYAMEYNFKDKLAVTDASRRKLAWKDIDGNIIYDTEGSQLSEKFFRVIRDRNSKLIGELIIDLGERNFDAQKRNDQVEIDALEELTDKLCNYRKHVSQGAGGKDNELKAAFVKCLCTLSAKT